MTEASKPAKTALITGASGGIGCALSRQFASHGFNLVLVARSADRLAALAKELAGRHGIQAETMVMDLSGTEAADQLFAFTQKQGIAVDVLVNNAGFGDSGLFADCAWKTQEEMIRLNILTLTHLTRLFLAPMVARKHGRILNIGSTGSFSPVPYMAVYGATKAFVLNFSEALAAELRGTGVTVTALCPGVTATQFFERAKAQKAIMARLVRMTPEAVAKVGFRALMQGKPRVVAGWFNKMMIASIRLMSRNSVMRFTKLLMKTE